jgi:hypothetical protein
LFPELADRLTTIRPNGKVAIEILTSELAIKTAAGCRVDHVVYLNREGHNGPALLGRLSKERALEDWSKYNVFGTAEVREARRHCHERLSGAQLWEMRYSDLDDAVVRLNRLMDSGA